MGRSRPVSGNSRRENNKGLAATFASLAALLLLSTACTAADAHDGSTTEVSITRSGFVPATAHISPGDTVTWVNHGATAQNVVTVSRVKTGAMHFHSGPLFPKDHYSHTFHEAGLYVYRSTLARQYSLLGSVVVRRH